MNNNYFFSEDIYKKNNYFLNVFHVHKFSALSQYLFFIYMKKEITSYYALMPECTSEIKDKSTCIAYRILSRGAFRLENSIYIVIALTPTNQLLHSHL